uniref:Bromo domain-containing protein n=1 Tax=Guillardia theta (strain CCMP2712) TaxID=905079 RepID=A0A0C3SGF9_GUITC
MKCVRGIKRRRQDPLSFLNSIFQTANEAMKSNPKSLPFRSPVDTKTNPNYRKVIKKPIDLNIIRTRIDESLYKSKDEYMADVDLMVENCKTYNVADMMLVHDVMELKNICQGVLRSRKKEIAEAEAMIQISEIFK